MSDQPADKPSDEDRPGPYPGVFGGESGAQPGPPKPGTGPYPDRPGPYTGSFGTPHGTPPGTPSHGTPPYGTPPGGQPYGSPGDPSYAARRPNPYANLQQPPPKQVTIASAISFGLGGLCALLGLFALTSAGDQISETLTGSPDAKNLVVGVILVCGAAYILPAIYLRKRRPWARIMLIVVAAFGIAGGVSALPNSILGLALHIALLVLMMQTPTKHWFTTRH